MPWGPGGILFTHIMPLGRTPPDARLFENPGNGGFVLWQDTSSHLRAQRFDSTGTLLWDTAGVRLSSDTAVQETMAENGRQFDRGAVVSDGDSGIIVVWMSPSRSPGRNDRDVYAQRIDRNGVVRWGSAGVVVCSAPGEQRNPRPVSDGSGGVIVIWADRRTDTSATATNINVYAQRINSQGVPVWQQDGIPVRLAPGVIDHYSLRITTDMAGGAIMAWVDNRYPGRWLLYVARINRDGLLVPVELSSFTASLEGDRVRLSWQTESETNNAGFEVERSVFIAHPNQSDSPAEWTRIGYVAGSGSTSQARQYEFYDPLSAELASTRVIRYRLRQVDFDGSFRYSNEVEVYPGLPSALQISLHQKDKEFLVRYELPSEGEVLLQVFDPLGRVVKTLVSGRADAGTHYATFNTSRLPSGMYFYTLTFRGERIVKRMMVVK